MPDSGQSSLASFIDHTLLRPDAMVSDIERLCTEAIEHNFKAVCVHGSYLPLAHSLLQGTPVLLAVVCGFPLGATPAAVKAFEAETYLKQGAAEIDMVVNLGWIKSAQWEMLGEELLLLRGVAPAATLKLILETAYLGRDEIIRCCELAVEHSWNFVKTSTGFGPGGASLKDVRLMKEIVGNHLQVKASGGIRDLETARAFIAAGASRIGTSSGLKIMMAEQQESKN
jgi:deoxyribose-phosphate aldolase